MRTLSRLSLVLVVAGAAVVAARAQSAAVVTPELILTIAQAVDAQLSPDGTDRRLPGLTAAAGRRAVWRRAQRTLDRAGRGR